MERKNKILILVISLLILFSCDYKKTQVINTVHKDGSITRKVMVETNTSKFLDFKEINVPVDSTWQFKTTMEIKELENEEKDTIWHLTAEKIFNNVDEINYDYQNKTGANSSLKRKAKFTKRFRWFTTLYRYSESVEKILNITCPLSEFLNEKELNFIYLPEKVQDALKNGPDSLQYKSFIDTLEIKSETWLWVSEYRQMAKVFYEMFGDDPNLTLSKEKMLSKELEFASYIMNNDNTEENDESHTDSVFIALYGQEFYASFKSEIDSAITRVDEIDTPFWDAGEYDMEIRMPGKIIASNGYAETGAEYGEGKGILWTVSGAYFLTQDFEMWAESRVNNYLLWMITALFILFVITGLLKFKKNI